MFFSNVNSNDIMRAFYENRYESLSRDYENRSFENRILNMNNNNYNRNNYYGNNYNNNGNGSYDGFDERYN